MKTRPLFILIIVLVFVCTSLLYAGCKNEGSDTELNISQDVVKEEDPEEKTEEAVDSGQAEEEGPKEGQDQVDDEKETQDEQTEEEIEIPDEITLKIEEADSLFQEGLYAEASKEYRNAQIAIEGSDLPEEVKVDLLDAIDDNYNTSNNIAETARMHHSNAMNLIYEKRYEEAEAELRAALDIYPKYQTAIEALESLEDIKGLQ